MTTNAGWTDAVPMGFPGGDPARAVPALRDRWRDESVRSVWLRPSDWYHPAVDALADALLRGGGSAADGVPDVQAAAVDLGRARGYDGVGIGETLDDLACLYRMLGTTEPPMLVVRALCDGWADAQAGAVTSGTALDPESGLPTRQYLGIRLAETYLRAELPTQRARTVADAGHHLVLIDVAAGDVDAFTRAARSAAVGAALTTTYGDGHPMATLGGGVFAVLAHADENPRRPLEALHREIARRCELLELRSSTRQPVRVWIEPLPATHEQALRTLERAARP